MRTVDRIIDVVLAPLSVFAAPFLYLAARKRWVLRLTRRVHDAIGVTVVRNHYYEPVFTARELFTPSSKVRFLPGLDFNLDGQIATLERFRFAEELLALDGGVVGDQTYFYANRAFAEGDADSLYSFIRAFKPRTVIEIGCGQSSIVAELALRKNSVEDPDYAPRHVCFEPFHNSWLKGIGAEYVRQRIEYVDLTLFEKLQANDIVFVDSTHVLRPQGDIEHLFSRILPILPVGVFVHFHDIYTPRDYIHQFLYEDRRMWTEQYILEAFLCFNSKYEIMLALHDLHQRKENTLYNAFPVLLNKTDTNPGSFWIRRRR
jgi:Methyltransferase domain